MEKQGRKSVRGLRPTQRDRDVLAMVAAYGGVSVDHLRGRFWSSAAFPSACYARIARLVEAGWLRSSRLASPTGLGTGKAILTMDHGGRQILAADLGVRPADIPLASPLSHPMTAAHHLAVCDFRLALELATQKRSDVCLTTWITESELRRGPMRVLDTYTVLGSPVRRQITLIPDAAFTLAIEGEQQPGMLEMDMGTTSLPRLEVKLRGYLRQQQSTPVPLFLVTVDDRRAQRIAQTVEAQAADLRANSTLVFVSTRGRLNPETILTSDVWHQVGVATPIAIVPDSRGENGR